MEFARPYALLLLLVVPVAYYAYRRSLVDLSRFQRRVGLVVRTIILVLLVLALAGVRLVSYSKRLAVIFVLDGSQSIPEASFREGERFVREAIASRHAGQRVSATPAEREAERRLTEQAEATYRQLIADWKATGTARKSAGATNGHASSRPATGQAARQAPSPTPAL